MPRTVSGNMISGVKMPVPDSAAKDSGNTTNNSNGAVKTDKAFPALIVHTVMISVCAIAYIRRKYLIDKAK